MTIASPQLESPSSSSGPPAYSNFFVVAMQRRFVSEVLHVAPQIMPDVAWFIRQFQKGVMESAKDVVDVCGMKGFQRRLALIHGGLLMKVFSEHSFLWAVNTLTGEERRSLLTYFISRTGSFVAPYPDVTPLSILGSCTMTRKEALQIVDQTRGGDGSVHELQVRCFLNMLDEANAADESSEFSTLESMHEMNLAVGAKAALVAKLLERGMWVSAISLCTPQHLVASAELTARAHAAVGDWRMALQMANSDLSLRKVAVDVLLDEKLPLLAWSLWRRGWCPRQESRLLQELAETKSDERDSRELASVIDQAVGEVNKATITADVRIASALALAACGSWQQVLAWVGSDDPVMRDERVLNSVLVCSARGGAPWSVLRQAAVSCAEFLSTDREPLLKTLVRCALESGHWIEALQLHRKYTLGGDVLDHTELVGRVDSRFLSGATLLRAGAWEQALKVEGSRLAVSEYCCARHDLWKAALQLGQLSRTIVTMCGATSTWRTAIQHLWSKVPQHRQPFLAKSALRSLNDGPGCSAAFSVAAALLGSDLNGASVLHHELQCPSPLTLQCLVPACKSWSDALSLCAASRPFAPTFVSAIGMAMAAKVFSSCYVVMHFRTSSGRRREHKMPTVLIFDVKMAPQVNKAASESLDVVPSYFQDACWQSALRQAQASNWRPSTMPLLGTMPVMQAAVVLSSHAGSISASAASKWLFGASAARNWLTALQVIQAMHETKVTLEMIELVRLAESCFNQEHFGVVVYHIHRHCAAADAVFRAVAERASRSEGSLSEWATALKTLQTIAVAGISYCPANSLKTIATLAPSSALRSLVGLVEGMCQRQTTPMPLECQAVVQIAKSCMTVGKNPRTEAVLVKRNVDGAQTVLVSSNYSSAVGTTASDVVKFVYRQRLLPVWFLALRACIQDGACVTMHPRDRNRVVQLVSLGCSEPETIFTVVSHISGLSERTLVCAASAIVHHGRWDLALRALGPESALDTPSPTLRDAKVAALQSNSAFVEVATMLKTLIGQSKRKKTSLSDLPLAMLVRDSGLAQEEAFRWWTSNQRL